MGFILLDSSFEQRLRLGHESLNHLLLVDRGCVSSAFSKVSLRKEEMAKRGLCVGKWWFHLFFHGGEGEVRATWIVSCQAGTLVKQAPVEHE